MDRNKRSQEEAAAETEDQAAVPGGTNGSREETAVDPLVELQQENVSLRKELDETRDRLLRKAAEFQNYRRRTEEEKRILVDIGKSAVVMQLLDVVDDLARTVEATESDDATAESLREGIGMVYRKLMDELKKLDVEPIEAVGMPFDEHRHDAMMRQPAPEGTAPGTILHEIQRGYRMGDRVLRHARVVVASERD